MKQNLQIKKLQIMSKLSVKKSKSFMNLKLICKRLLNNNLKYFTIYLFIILFLGLKINSIIGINHYYNKR